MSSPSDLKYSASHEWLRLDGDVVTVGITDHAQAELGDIVYLELPEPGRMLAKEEMFGTVESVKAVSDLYSPVSGEVIETNTSITDTTEVVNQDPYDGGWMVKVRLSNSSELEGLLNATDYDKLLDAAH